MLSLVALATLPKLSNAFVWDDLALIVESEFIHQPTNLARVFGVDTMFAADGGKFQHIAQLDTYRPITIATFFVDAAISGKEPLAYHINNLLIHLACVALVYALALHLLWPLYADRSPRETRRIAWWAALWFGLHPLLAEAHVWINGRSDLWCTAFGLSGVLVWLRARACSDTGTRAGLLSLSGALFLLGLLSKESLLPALFVLVVWSTGAFERRLSELDLSRRNLLSFLPIGIAIGAYLLLRWNALSGLRVSAGSPQLALASARLPVLLLDGLTQALLPTRLMPRYLDETYGRLSSAALLGCAALLVALVVLGWIWRRRLPLLAFALAWFTAVLAPASLITTLQWYGFGRFLYLPLTLLSIALADVTFRALTSLRRSPRPALVRLGQLTAVCYVAGLGLRLALNTPAWDGPPAFYTQILTEQPDASHGYGGLGKWLIEEGRPDLAISPLEKAVEVGPRDSRYLNNLGVAFLRSGRRAEALAVAERGMARFPDQRKFRNLHNLASEPR